MTDIVNGLLIRNQSVLMAKRAAHRRIYPSIWSFPGGHVENSESLEQALVRELREELGIAEISCSFMQDVKVTPPQSEDSIRFHFFVVTCWKGTPKLLDDEHTDMRWLDLRNGAKTTDLALPIYTALLEQLRRDRI